MLLPQQATIAQLTALPAPPSPPPDARANAIERTTYQLTNVTLQHVIYQHDGDYHLVVADASNRTMIAEIPAPLCAQQSPLLSQINGARSAVDARLGLTFTNVAENAIVSVRGVGFFDFYHSQAGQARNGIEVHPVTAVCFSLNCSLP